MNVDLFIFSSLFKKRRLLLNTLNNITRSYILCVLGLGLHTSDCYECVQPVIASIITQTALLLVATISPNPTHGLYKMSIQCVAAQRMDAKAWRFA